MNMVEKIAKAIEDNIKSALPDGITIDYEYAARAAIEEMLESNVPKPPKITINGEEVPHAAALWLCSVAATAHNSFGKGKLAELFQPTVDALINGGENIDHFRDAKPRGYAADWFPKLYR